VTKKKLIEILSDKKIPNDCEIKVLCTRSMPIPVETAYYDKPDKRIIIETN
jgi:hypothetical protein